MNTDRTILSSGMLARAKRARLSWEEAKNEAGEEWCSNHRWLASKAEGRGSFLWFCEQLDLEPDAVREAIAGG